MLRHLGVRPMSSHGVISSSPSTACIQTLSTLKQIMIQNMLSEAASHSPHAESMKMSKACMRQEPSLVPRIMCSSLYTAY